MNFFIDISAQCSFYRARPESGLDRLDSTLFVLAILSRIVDRRRRRRFAPSLTRSPTRTTQHPSDQGRHPLSRKRIDPWQPLDKPPAEENNGVKPH
jgi:hypothetical protein